MLAPPTALARMAGRARGRFSVDEIAGHDLGVMWSVDQTEIGRELRSAVAPTRIPKTTRHNGGWYRLEQEPPPIHYTNELQQVLTGGGHTVSFTSRSRARAHRAHLP